MTIAPRVHPESREGKGGAVLAPSDLSLEALFARLEERLAQLEAQMNRRFDATKLDMSDGWAASLAAGADQTRTMRALEARERERNGHIEDLTRADKANQQRWHEHELWAQGFDASLSSRIGKLEGEAHDRGVIVRFLQSEWKVVTASTALGATLGAIGHYLGLL